MNKILKILFAIEFVLLLMIIALFKKEWVDPRNTDDKN